MSMECISVCVCVFEVVWLRFLPQHLWIHIHTFSVVWFHTHTHTLTLHSSSRLHLAEQHKRFHFTHKQASQTRLSIFIWHGLQTHTGDQFVGVESCMHVPFLVIYRYHTQIHPTHIYTHATYPYTSRYVRSRSIDIWGWAKVYEP